MPLLRIGWIGILRSNVRSLVDDLDKVKSVLWDGYLCFKDNSWWALSENPYPACGSFWIRFGTEVDFSPNFFWTINGTTSERIEFSLHILFLNSRLYAATIFAMWKVPTKVWCSVPVYNHLLLTVHMHLSLRSTALCFTLLRSSKSWLIKEKNCIGRQVA